MRKFDFVVASMLIVTMVSTAQGQSIAERLKKAIKVSVKKPDSAAQPDPTSQRTPGQRATRGPLPTSSIPHPDVIGIKVGLSTEDDVKAALSVPSLGLILEERFPWVNAATRFPTSLTPTCQDRPKCQTITVDFARPPNQPIALSLRRTIMFGESGPLTENIVNNLVEKYGQPGFRSDYQGVETRLAWAWAADGSPVGLNERHPCATQIWAANAANENSRAALEAGCAAIVYAVINQRNGVAHLQLVFSIDHFAIYTSRQKTAAFVQDMKLRNEACQRERAAKAGVPTEFGDPAPAGKTVAAPPSGTAKSGSAAATVPDTACAALTKALAN